MVLYPVAYVFQDVFYGFCGADGKGGFFDDDFIAGGDCSNLPGTALYKLQIRSHSLAPTVGLGGRIDRYKNHLRLRNRSVYILRKEQVSATSLGHYLRQSGFVNGQMIQILTNSRFRPLSKP